MPTADDINAFQARFRMCMTVGVAVISVGAVVAAFVVTTKPLVASKSKSPSKKAPATPGGCTATSTAKEGNDSTETPGEPTHDDDVEGKIHRELSVHDQNDNEGMKEMLQQQFGQMQGEAVLKMLSEKQMQKFQERQMLIQVCSSEQEKMMKMQELQVWVSKQLTKKQRVELEDQMYLLAEELQMKRAEFQIELGREEIREALLNEEQREQLQKGKQEAELYQQAGMMPKTMETLSKVNEDIEASLTPQQIADRNATLLARKEGIFSDFLSKSMDNALIMKKKELTMTRMNAAQKQKLEAMQDELSAMMQSAEQQEKLLACQEFLENVLDDEQKKEMQAELEAVKPAMRQERLLVIQEKLNAFVKDSLLQEILSGDQKKRANKALQELQKISMLAMQGQATGDAVKQKEMKYKAKLESCLTEEQREKLKKKLKKLQTEHVPSALERIAKGATGLVAPTEALDIAEQQMENLLKEVETDGSDKDYAQEQLQKVLDRLDTMRNDIQQKLANSKDPLNAAFEAQHTKQNADQVD